MTAARTTGSAEKKQTINVTVNPKSLAVPAVSGKPVVVKQPTKMIDMGAALTYGAHSDLGINSPTHRSTHADENLFDADGVSSAPTAGVSQGDLLDDLFKTCASVPQTVVSKVQPAATGAEDDFFNPREDESQEFGDFASAFGNSTAPVQSAPVAASLPRPPSAGADEFADFSSAFVPVAPAANINANASNDLLFGTPTISQPLFAAPSGPSSLANNSAPVTDLLSDLDGLSLGGAPVPSGKSKV